MENTLAAVAAALALKVPAEVIRARAEIVRRRHGKGARPLQRAGDPRGDGDRRLRAQRRRPGGLDRGRWSKFPHQRRTCVYTTAGDRRDCDMIRQGQLLGEAFDRVILYEDHYLRGRPDGEIIRLIRQGMESGSRDASRSRRSAGRTRRSRWRCGRAQPGDLMLVQADTIDETVQFIRRYIDNDGGAGDRRRADGGGERSGPQGCARGGQVQVARGGGRVSGHRHLADDRQGVTISSPLLLATCGKKGEELKVRAAHGSAIDSVGNRTSRIRISSAPAADYDTDDTWDDRPPCGEMG